MLKRIADRLLLTKTERNVILFLAITLLAGAGIRLYQTAFSSAPQFDYSASDSTFAALSAVPEDSIANINNKGFPVEKSDKLNINTATKEQLMDLPGVGEVTADRIIKYRSETGRFAAIGDLRAIKGMSKKKIEHIKSLITTQ
jgi:competence ComEA-like helix-hairpin-helix protein